MMEKGKRLFGKKLSTEQAFWLCLVNGASPVAAALLSDRLCGFLKPGTERLSAILVVGILLGSLVLLLDFFLILVPLDRLKKHAALSFWEKPDEDHTIVRLATSWATKEADILTFIKILKEIL